MADNITAPAAGAVLATDEIGGVHFPRTKITFGADGAQVDASASNPLPVVAALPTGASTADAQATAITALADILAALGATITVDGTIALDSATLTALETIELGATTLAALENITATVTGVATAANQTTLIGHVDGIEASLASILAKIIAAPATEAKQDALIALYTLPAGTDRSGSITTGGTAQQLAAANAARKSLVVQNISDADLWINEIGGTAAADTAGSWKVTAGSAFAVSTNRAISIIGATTGKKFTATEI